jgi:hypothetical protein
MGGHHVSVCVTSVEVFDLQLTQYERCTAGAHPSALLRDFIQSVIDNPRACEAGAPPLR